jgi:trans-2,3-dihydro-3-hydroxyanthranilate isomerase
MTASYDYVIADVFTDTPLSGNQLAVFVDGDAVPESLMQPLAREIGFAETVFVGAGDRIRIFTPAKELPFAGHPVLGTAYVLVQQRGVDAIELSTKQGAITLTFDDNGRGRMQQPLPAVAPWEGDVDALLSALGVKQSRRPIDLYDNGVPHLYVVLESEDDVAGLRPDFGRLGLIAPREGVNCAAGHGTTWKSRMFGMGLGMSEDAATGSAAGPLAVHLGRYGDVPWGTEIAITQGVEMGRASTLYAVAFGSDDGLTAVEVAGDTVVVGRGTFDL